MTTFKCKCHWCGASLIRRKQTKAVRFHFCNRMCKGEFQKTAKPVTKEWLFEHYVTMGLDTTKIGHLVKRDPKSVWNWLKDFGIPIRRRGFGGPKENLFQKGMTSSFKGKKHSEKTKKLLSDLAKADGRVPFDPNVGPPFKGKRGAETPNWRGGITPERQAFYSSQEWAKIVPLVWKRDCATCQRCGKKNKKGERFTFDIHHIVGFQVVSLRAVLSNLVLLCEHCHYWVHSNANANREFIG